jgi:hypothetical protein
MTDAPKSKRPKKDLWVWLSLLPLGLGAWASIVAGIRCGVRQWIGLGLFWFGTGVGGWALIFAGRVSANSNFDSDRLTHAQSAAVGWGSFLIFLSWIGGFAMAFSIRSEYEARRAHDRRPKAPWPQPTARSREWSAWYAVVAFVIAFALAIGVSLLLWYGLGVHYKVGIGVLIVDGALLAALIPLARKRGLSPRDLGIRPTPITRSAGLAILTFVVYIAFSIMYVLLFIGTSTQKSAGVVSQSNSSLSTVQTVIAIFAISISAPVVEEIFFRGLLYRSLRNRLPTLWAALIAGALFGLAHITGYPLITLPIKALFGVLACLLYQKTGSLFPGMAVHSFVDASAVDVALTGNDDIVLIVFGSVLVVIFIRWVVLGMLRSGPYVPLPPTQRPQTQ